MNIELKNKNNIWDSPWQYQESFTIVFTSIILGFGLEYFTSISFTSISFPNNLYTLFVYLTSLILVFILFRKSQIIKWLRSPYLAIASISSILFLVILMGSFTQDIPSKIVWINRLSLNRIAFSIPFLFSLFFFLTNLALVIIYRLKEFNLRSLLFAFNHIGIFVITISMIFSVGDIQKQTVRVDQDNFLFEINNGGHRIELPFALRLLDFNLELFPPKIAIVDNTTDNIVSGNGFLVSANTDSIITYKNYRVSIKQYLSKSVKQADKYYFVNDVGFSPSALLEITFPDGHTTEKWVSCGSFVYPSEFAVLDSNYTLVMLDPEAKNFQSKIQVSYPDKRQQNLILKVNQPVNIEGWDIYQTDYDKEMGTWSNYSILELVYDPWLNVIYIGIAMLISGAILLIFVGRNERIQ